MYAAVVTAENALEIQDVPDPTPEPREVVIKVAGVGVCGTDLHVLNGEYGQLPVIPGHEFSGEVVAVGGDVRDVAVGDLVAADPNDFCLVCHYCRQGRGSLCRHKRGMGTSTPGAVAQFTKAPAANCVVLPEGVDLEGAALIEPISCAVHALDVVRARLGTHLLIYGAGTMGIIMLELARSAGAITVDVVELNPDRRKTAEEFGCTAAVATADDVARPRGHDVVIDCTGAAAAIEDGITRVGPGGMFLHFGVTPTGAKVSYVANDVLLNEVSISGSNAVLHSFERAGELYAAGVVRADSIITHRYDLDESGDAFANVRAGIGLKHLIRPNGTLG